MTTHGGRRTARTRTTCARFRAIELGTPFALVPALAGGAAAPSTITLFFFALRFPGHPTRRCFHFDDDALQPIDSSGGGCARARMATFCVMDGDKVDGSLPGPSARTVDSARGGRVQGMSSGRADTYGAHLAARRIDSIDDADGICRLNTAIDPGTTVSESNRNDDGWRVLPNDAKPGAARVRARPVADPRCDPVSARPLRLAGHLV